MGMGHVVAAFAIQHLAWGQNSCVNTTSCFDPEENLKQSMLDFAFQVATPTLKWQLNARQKFPHHEQKWLNISPPSGVGVVRFLK